MIAHVRTLLTAFLEITFFRKGPSDIPDSSLLLVITATLWFFVGIGGVVIDSTYDGDGFLINLILTVIGIGLYSIVVNIFGSSERFRRALTAILGCGAIFNLVYLVGQLVLKNLIGVEETRMFWELILMWSILVEGHIIARTIDRQLFIGILFAMAVFFAQLQVLVVVTPMFGVTS